MAPDPHTDLPPLQLNHTSSDPTHISRTSADETDSARLSADVARSGSVGGGGGGSGGRGSLTLKRGGFEGRLDLSDLSPVGSSLPPSAANSVANTPLGESAWEAVRLGMRAESQAQAQAQAQEQAQAQAANGKGKESADHPPRRKGSMSHGNGSRYHFAWPTSPIDVARKRQLGAETSRSSALPPAGRQDAAATAADGNDASSTDRMPSAGGENGAAGSSSRTNTDNRGGRDQETSLDTEVEPSSMTISNTSTTPQNERRAQLQPLGSAQRPPLPHQHTFRAGAPEPSAAQGGSPADLATAIPKLHRALTVPLSARLGHLRHPGQSSMDTVQVNGSPRQSGEASQASAVVSSSKEEEGEADGDLESRSSPDKAASGAPSNGKEPATGRRRGLDFQRSATSPALIQSDRSQLSCLDARDEADHHPLAGFSNLLADFVQLPINTLLQLIPPHLLDPTHEQFSACSLHVPVTSVEALLEACRALNYLSKEMRRLGDEEASKLVRDRADSTQSLSRPAVLDGADQQVQEAGSAANIEPDQSCIEGGSTASEAGPSRSRLSLGLSDRSQNSASSSPQTPTFVRWGSHVHEDFDIGEMTQRIADVLSGMAAQKSVDLVIFHGDIALGKEDPSRDVELGHQSVRGDEGGVRFAVMHMVSRVIESASPGANIEIGLHILRHRARSQSSLGTVTDESSSDTGEDEERSADSPRTGNRSTKMLECTFEIIHTPAPSAAEIRNLLPHAPTQQILTSLGASLRTELPPRAPMPETKDTSIQRKRSQTSTDLRSVRHEVSFVLARGNPVVETAELSAEEEASRQRFFPALTVSREPTMQELLTFTEVLRGKRIALHARLDSVFAKHLTGYLTSWGCDIDHIPLDQLSEGHKSPHTAIALTEGRPSLVALPSDPGRGGVARSLTPNSAVLDPISGVPITVQSPGGTGSTPFSPEAARENGESSDNAGSAAPAEDAAGDVDGNLKIVPFSFVIIDDDAGTLQRELLRMRSAVPLLRSALSGSQSRPAFKHRPRSSPQISRVLASEGRLSTTPDGAGSTEGEAEGSNSSTGSSTYAIIHMTSLSNYRHIRDVVQSVITSASGTSPLPEVIVIPKPAGPRRILTALHTALHKPVIDPFFQPIATSPMSPGHYFFPGPGNGTLALDQSPSEQAPSIQGAIAPAVAPTQQPVPPTRRELSRFAAVSDRQTTTDRSSSATTTTQASSIPTKHASSSTVNHSAPSSPMPVDALEYFSETAARMGSSAASGMVIQSPDGRPAGIFFQPQPKTPSVHRRESAGILERSSPHGSTRRSVGDGSSHGSAPSIASGSRSVLGTKGPRRNTTSSKVYPSGSIFAPQVGIESILAGGHQPVATPLGQPQIPNASTSPWDIEARSPAATSSRVPSLAPSPVQPSRASNDHPHPRSASLSQGTSTNNVERVPASPARRSASQSDAATRASNNVPPPAQQVEVLASPPLQQREASPEASVSRGARSPVAAARHSFAMVQQPSRRPSAQPQAGLLIGAGFTPAAKKGGGPKKPPVREVVLPPINVLIVEDNPINQKILSTFMRRKKIRFEVANNGREAVEKWRTGGFHLILMDIQLPVLDGIEATKEIRKMERSANIGILPNTPPASELQTPPTAGPSTGSMTLQPPPASPFRASVIIVALTASVFNSDRVAALAAGCNDFLNKPVSLHWLEKKIIEWGSMQYILLSGFPSDNWNRWRQQTAGAGANAGGTNNSPRSQAALASQNELRRGFGSGPDANARALASRLHMPARRASPIRPAAPVRGSGSTGGPLVTATSRPSEAAAAASSSSGGGPTAPAPVFAPAFSAVPPSPSQIARTRAGSATAPPAPAPTSSAPTAPNAPTASTAPVISLTSSTPPEPRSERDPLDASSANPSADASADADLNSNSNSKTLPNTDLDLVQQQGEPSTSVAGGDGAAAPAAPAAPTEPTAPDAAQGS